MLEVPTPHSDTNKINLQIIKDHKTTHVLIAELFQCYMLRVPSGIIILRWTDFSSWMAMGELLVASDYWTGILKKKVTLQYVPEVLDATATWGTGFLEPPFKYFPNSFSSKHVRRHSLRLRLCFLWGIHICCKPHCRLTCFYSVLLKVYPISIWTCLLPKTVDNDTWKFSHILR